MKLLLPYSCRKTHGGAVLPPPRLTPNRERAGEGSNVPAKRASTAARPLGPSVAARRLDADPVSPRGQGRRGGGRSSPPGTKPSQALGRPSLRACGVEGRRAPRGRALRGSRAFDPHQLQAQLAAIKISQGHPSPRRVGLLDVPPPLQRLEHAPSPFVVQRGDDSPRVGWAPLAGFVDHYLKRLGLVCCELACGHLVPCWFGLQRGLRPDRRAGYTSTSRVTRCASGRAASPMSVLGGSLIGGRFTLVERRHDHEPR